jgi:hypothetical protein
LFLETVRQCKTQLGTLRLEQVVWVTSNNLLVEWPKTQQPAPHTPLRHPLYSQFLTAKKMFFSRFIKINWLTVEMLVNAFGSQLTRNCHLFIYFCIAIGIV